MCETEIIDCIQINKKHVYKERKETTHERVGERKTYINMQSYLKAFFYLFAFDFSLHVFLLSISYMGLLEREKKYPMIFDIPILLCLST